MYLCAGRGLARCGNSISVAPNLLNFWKLWLGFHTRLNFSRALVLWRPGQLCWDSSRGGRGARLGVIWWGREDEQGEKVSFSHDKERKHSTLTAEVLTSQLHMIRASFLGKC